MGMYTELIFGATLKEKTPTYVTDALNCIINDSVTTNLSDEAKQFIDEYSLSKLIWCSSYYFGAHSNKPSCVFDKIANRWCISFRANCKNYQGEIEKFIEFIKPYVEYGSGPTNIFAIVQYEEDDYPTLYGTEDKYEYLDEERITTDRKLANQMFDIMNDLYNCATPDLEITNEMLKEKGIDPDDYSGVDGYKIMRDVIIRRLKDIGYDEEFAKLAKANQELREKLMYTEFDRDDYKNKVERLKKELEECKSSNSIMSI